MRSSPVMFTALLRRVVRLVSHNTHYVVRPRAPGRGEAALPGGFLLISRVQQTATGLSVLWPPLKGVNARPAASGCTGSHCALLRCSFPVRQLPLPAPVRGGHAKPCVPSPLPRLRAPPGSACGLRQPGPGRRFAVMKSGNDSGGRAGYDAL